MAVNEHELDVLAEGDSNADIDIYNNIEVDDIIEVGAYIEDEVIPLGEYIEFFDEDVPLADFDTLIFEDDIPLSEMPQTGLADSVSLLSGALLLTALFSAVITKFIRKMRKQDEEN